MSNARKLADNLPTEGQLGNRNIVINGEFFVSQRGDYSSATSASTGTYYMDRWAVDFSGVTATIQNQSTDLPNGVTAKTFKLAATSSATGYLQIRQKIEPASYMDNRKVTVSAYVRSNSSLPRLRIEGAGASSTNIDGTQTHTGGGDWEKLTFTTTLKDGITAFTVGCILWNGSTVSISSGNYVEISQFQVEFGETVTPFEHRSFGQELQACQRYFSKSYRYDKYAGDTSSLGWVQTEFHENNQGAGYREYYAFPFAVRMRATPTITIYDTAGNSGKCNYYISVGSGNTNKVLNVSSTNERTFGGYSDRATTIGGWACHYLADAEL